MGFNTHLTALIIQDDEKTVKYNFKGFLRRILILCSSSQFFHAASVGVSLKGLKKVEKSMYVSYDIQTQYIKICL